MKIAVIGSGISGLAAAWLLSKEHLVDIYEKDDRLGGHANTQQIHMDGTKASVDTGFIVFNKRTYPNLTALFDLLEVETVPTQMSFSVSLQNGEKEYSGSGLKGLFAQKSNLFRPKFLQMISQTMHFYKHASRHAKKSEFRETTLGDYLVQKNYSATFIDEHLLPMGAAIWSMPPKQLLNFPFRTFISFCNNHGLLQLKDRPQWRTVAGGSCNYVRKIAERISGKIFLNTAVKDVQRSLRSVKVSTRTGQEASYDHVIFACHSDQALAILNCQNSASEAETKILGSIRYQQNIAVLHRDFSLMPKRKAAWSAWNFTGNHNNNNALSVTYWMNALQQLNITRNVFVTLNPNQQPAEGTILRSFQYAHPVFDRAALKAQKHVWQIQGENRTWFCGAYLGYGFHEDGLQAGLAVAEALGVAQRDWVCQNQNGRIALPVGWPLRSYQVAAQ
ncbi:protoporphyrinogen oxidase [Pseudovibrio axinellae]|uniref:Protoporphyrinogen oxidase n=1 Tax=Pseudovibrio axinellae TaxID=989403 RepID=A0A165XSP3_9HYPH|nr:FAD-dependent oxidoreductase [Pseudovibrio axinellae]KZL18000.1 protoporphyrinogen oxidase [Pseudovibrio axinellae]SER13968.1 Predicted NAD/FAD-binding protein [Pseudovibrio axinellae]